jgi:hypothetical protein
MFRGALLVAMLAAPGAAWACKCALNLSTCNEVWESHFVLSGTVEAIEPQFLDRWNLGQRSSLSSLNQQSRESDIEKLRASYRRIFPDISDEGKKKLETAKTQADFASLFSWILEHGRMIRLRVHTMYRNEGGDDDGPKDGTFIVWTPFGDCGVNFQVGETYLVFADGDDESDIISTTACSRTKRLSDAGEELAYLQFYQMDKERSSRLEGWVTANPTYQREYDPKHYSPAISQAVGGAVVELSGPQGNRYATTDAGGRFLFDGLAAGGYSTTAYAEGFPETKILVAGPQSARIEAKSCSVQVLVTPKSDVKQPEK